MRAPRHQKIAHYVAIGVEDADVWHRADVDALLSARLAKQRVRREN
jgi:hypothetical protein